MLRSNPAYLVLISRPLGVVRTFITENCAKISAIYNLLGKENQIEDFLDYGFLNQSLCYVISGGIAWK